MHSLHIILRCDVQLPDPDPGGRGFRRCPGYLIGSSGEDIDTVRQRAADKRWTFTPGNPYRHIGGTDKCPAHDPPPEPKEPA